MSFFPFAQPCAGQVLAFTLSACTLGALAGPPTYRIEDNPLTATSWQEAIDINNAGQVLMNNANSSTTPYIWNSNGATQYIPTPHGFGYLFARQINDDGVVAGYAIRQCCYYGFSALTWSTGTGTVLIPELLDTGDSTAWFINNSGVVSGRGTYEDVSQRPYFYKPDRGIWFPHRPRDEPRKYLEINGLNDHGDWIATAYLANRFFAVFTKRDGTWSLIDALPSSPGKRKGSSTPLSLNQRGQVVGWSSAANNLNWSLYRRPFVWSQQDGIVEIPLPRKYDYSQANDINDQGQVVGSARDRDKVERGFYWDSRSGPHLLNDLIAATDPRRSTYSIMRAMAINNSGVIAATATTSTGTWRVVRLVPLSN